MSPLLIWVITVCLFGLGLLGVVVPVLPGILLVLVGILFYSWMTGFASISVATVVALGIIIGLGALAEYVGSALGAKYGGGGKLTVLGAVLGAVIGVFSSGALGLFIGVFVGALLGALIEGKEIDKAGKAAAFSVVGVLGSKLVQLMLAGLVIILFFMAVFL
jgi:hypothetical protein